MAGGLFVLPKMHKITQNSLLKKHGIFCLTFSHQQQRLKLLYDAQIQQHAGDAQHDEAAPVAVLGKEVEAGVL